MRLNLYTATCSLLAYGITALNIGSIDASLESAASFNDFAQSYADQYDHDLAQTYADLNTSRGGRSCSSTSIDKLKSKLAKLKSTERSLRSASNYRSKSCIGSSKKSPISSKSSIKKLAKADDGLGCSKKLRSSSLRSSLHSSKLDKEMEDNHLHGLSS